VLYFLFPQSFPHSAFSVFSNETSLRPLNSCYIGGRGIVSAEDNNGKRAMGVCTGYGGAGKFLSDDPSCYLIIVYLNPSRTAGGKIYK
jgi:hypothetical protein